MTIFTQSHLQAHLPLNDVNIFQCQAPHVARPQRCFHTFFFFFAPRFWLCVWEWHSARSRCFCLVFFLLCVCKWKHVCLYTHIYIHTFLALAHWKIYIYIYILYIYIYILIYIYIKIIYTWGWVWRFEDFKGDFLDLEEACGCITFRLAKSWWRVRASSCIHHA